MIEPRYFSSSYRYYYAIATFSSAAAATYVFREVNGTEFERTANIFDITFVPDDMDFDSEWRDEAEEEDKSYKGTDYVTDVSRESFATMYHSASDTWSCLFH